MGFLTTLLGAPKIVNTVADTVKGGMDFVDKAFYTNQEKAENANKLMEVWVKIQGAIAQENSIRSVTRRLLAWATMGLFLFLVFMACALWKIDPEWAKYIKDTTIEMKLAYLALLVGFFYFGSYALSGHLFPKKK
ncbi:MAG: hypothetical protein KAU20_05580 [Nanoarchaeota archaeon]|nr:hypothetical protein [Nanoarchaeota archaeon]